MANYDFTYTGAEIQHILDTAKKLKDSGYIFLGVATPSTNPGTPTQKVYYEAKQAGTYTNFGGAVLPDGISLLIWNGSWTSETMICGDGGVFDISVYKSSGGTLATYADLAAALDGGNNIPAAARKGGMSVKFVQTSDNKYIQYRLTNQNWSIMPSDWQEEIMHDITFEATQNLWTKGDISISGNTVIGTIGVKMFDAGTYTMSFVTNKGLTLTIYAPTGAVGYKSFNGSTNRQYLTFTSEAQIERFFFQVSEQTSITDIQFELGSAATPYITPYTVVDLRSVRTTIQSLSDTEKETARNNIGATSFENLTELEGKIYEVVGNFTQKAASSQEQGVYDVNGNFVQSSLYTYYYDVNEGDVLKIYNTNAYSTPGYSVIGMLNGSTWVGSFLDSPSKANLTLYLTVPSGVNKIAIGYYSNNVYQLDINIDEVKREVANLIKPTRNIFPLDTNISVATPTIFGVVGVTLIPAGTYILTYENAPEDASWYCYQSSGMTNLWVPKTTNGRNCVVATFEHDVERIYITFTGETARSYQKIQLEVLDWKGYEGGSTSTWKNLPYGTPYIDKKTTQDIISRELLSYWEGKKINYNGDSVTQGSYSDGTGYAKVVNQILKFGTVRNYAIGGTRLAHVEGEQYAMVDRYSDMSLDADIVYIMANTNDYASQVPIGSDDDNINTTYKGALNIIFTWLKANYPTQPIIISTMLTRKVNYDGGQPLPITIEQYAEAVRVMTAKYGFILYDAYKLSGLDLLNSPTDGTGITDDGLHPNAAGALALGRKVAAFINAQ